MKLFSLIKPESLVIVSLTVLIANGFSQNATIPFDTLSAPLWKVTAGGVFGATPYQVDNMISVSSTGNETGTFLAGGNRANWNGFWVADFTFFLPANATGISLNYSNFYADDRAVLTLNGQIFDATGIPFFGHLNDVGSMVFTDGGATQGYSSFSSPDGSVSGVVTSGFHVGGSNLLEAIVNNTKTGVYGTDSNFQTGDGTLLGLSGAVSYSIVPEPSFTPILLGAFALYFGGRVYLRRKF
jgi:hypothetical protein